MPVRLLNSSVIKWPDQDQVDAAAREWAANVAPEHPELVKLGYFGSYARGDWGVGSDLDVVALVADSELSFAERPMAWDLLSLPVPAEIVIYTLVEWQELKEEGARLVETIDREVVWLYLSPDHRLQQPELTTINEVQR